MEEDIRSNEYLYWNTEWNVQVKDDKHLEILLAEINNSITNLKKENDRTNTRYN